MKKLLLISFVGFLFSTCFGQQVNKPNILFISIDDMNDWTTLFDKSNPIKTPNLERLAARGCFFERAYCTSPGCAPSRNSIMTGLKPTTSGLYGFQPWREALPNEVTLPKYFNNYGWATRGAGKLFHHGKQPGSNVGGGDDAPAKINSFEEFYPMQMGNVKGANLNGFTEGKIGVKAGDWGEANVKMVDHYTVEWIEEQLAKQWDKPLFLAAGIYKPHLPHYAPSDIFDLYPFDETRLPPMPEDDFDDLSEAAYKMSQNQHFRYQLPMEQPENSPGSFKKMIQSYQASATFADRMIGRIIDKLDESGMADNTIIVLWADHGYHLGDKKSVVKFTLWEKANRVPFIIVAPGVTTPGSRCSRPVSLVNIYKTLVELSGLPQKEGIDGNSLVPLLKNPNMEWNYPALMSQGEGNYAIRSDRWRYIRYKNGEEELYDHDNDPWEHNNLAGDDKYAGVLAEHRQYLPKNEAPSFKPKPRNKE